MKLNNLERRLERELATLVAARLGMTVENVEEIVCQPGNRWLKGGKAVGVIYRVEPNSYHGLIVANLPCEKCQKAGATFRLCKCPNIGQRGFDKIPPEDVPEQFHRNVGDEGVSVMEWEW